MHVWTAVSQICIYCISSPYNLYQNDSPVAHCVVAQGFTLWPYHFLCRPFVAAIGLPIPAQDVKLRMYDKTYGAWLYITVDNFITVESHQHIYLATAGVTSPRDLQYCLNLEVASVKREVQLAAAQIPVAPHTPATLQTTVTL